MPIKPFRLRDENNDLRSIVAPMTLVCTCHRSIACPDTDTVLARKEVNLFAGAMGQYRRSTLPNLGERYV